MKSDDRHLFDMRGIDFFLKLRANQSRVNFALSSITHGGMIEKEKQKILKTTKNIPIGWKIMQQRQIKKAGATDSKI